MSELTDDQRAAVEAERDSCVISVPGSGKTTMVIAKIARILSTNKAAKLVAITFTAHAAQELRTRAAAALGSNASDSERLKAGTFHALAWKELKERKHPLTKRRIAPTGLRNHYLAMALEAHGLPTDAEETGWVERYWSTTQDPIDGKDSSGQHIDQLWVARYEAIQDYKELMRGAGLADFGMILEAALQWYKPDGRRVSIAEESNFDRTGESLFGGTHMLVDEAQDIDAVQLSIILNEKFHAGTTVHMVGDDDQSIFAFRYGLGVKGMQTFMEHAKAVELKLGTNFRCLRNILELGKQVIEQNKRRIPKDLVAQRGSGGKVVFRVFEDDTAERSEVSEQARLAIDSGVVGPHPKTAAILARTNALLDEMELTLHEKGVEFERLGGKSVLDQPPLCFFISALEAVATNGNDDGVKSALEQLVYWKGGSREDIAHLNTLSPSALSKAVQDGKGLSSMLGGMKGGYEAALDTCAMLRPALALGTSRDGDAVDATVKKMATWFANHAYDAEAVVDRKRMNRAKLDPRADAPERSEDQLGASAAYKAMMIRSVARTLAGAKGVPDEADLIPEIAEFMDPDDGDADGEARRSRTGTLASRLAALKGLQKKAEDGGARLKLSTMHSSKGLEFNNTYIIGADRKALRCGSEDQGEVEEERRLLYVAITRAKDEVWVTCHERHGKAPKRSAEEQEGNEKPATMRQKDSKPKLEMCTYITETTSYQEHLAHEAGRVRSTAADLKT